MSIDQLVANTESKLTSWRLGVEKLSGMAQLSVRKSIAYLEDIPGYNFGIDNVGWVGFTLSCGLCPLPKQYHKWKRGPC